MNITIERQEQYKKLIAKGYTSKQIGDELKISSGTVKAHLIKLGLRTIYKKDPIIIDENKLRDLVIKHYSIDKISKEFGCGHASIKTALKRHGLKTEAKWTIGRKVASEEIKSGFKTCNKCGVKKELNSDNFYIKKSGVFHHWCKKCNCQITYDKQRKIKTDALAYKGGKCCMCGYNKYFGALEFHHLDPSKKEFSIGELRAYRWEKLKPELDKCICVCKNCHAEIHGKIVGLTGFEPITKALLTNHSETNEL